MKKIVWLLFVLIIENAYSHSANFYIPQFKYTKSLLLSKDEKYLFASNSTDIIMWDIEKKKLKKYFKGDTHIIKNMLLTHDGNYILTLSGKSIKIWSIEKGRVIKTFFRGKESIVFMALSQDGKKVISASLDGVVKVFNFATKKIIKKFSTDSKGRAFALSHDEKYMLALSNREGIALWSMENAKKLDVFKIKSRYIYSVAFSSDDKYLLASLQEEKSYKDVILVWERATKKIIQRIVLDNLHMKTVVTKDNKYVVVAETNGWVEFFSLISGEKVKSFQGEGGNILSLLFNKNESKIFFASREGVVNIWEMQKNRKIALLKGDSIMNIENLLLTHDEKTMLLLYANGSIVFLNYEKGEPFKIIQDANAVYGSVHVGNNEKYMLTQSYADTHMWNLSQEKQLKIFQGKSVTSDKSITFCDNGDSVAVGASNGVVTIWNLEHQEKTKTFKGDNSTILSIQFSDDEHYMLSATKDMAKVWNVETQKEIRTFQITDARTLRLSASGKKVVWGMYGNLIAVYDVKKGKIVHRLKGHHYPIRNLKISEDDRYLVSNSSEGYIKLWNLETGKESQAFRKQYGRLTQFAIGKHAKYVVLGMISGNIRVWDIAKKREKRVFKGKDGIGKVLLSKDERYIFSATRFTGIAKVWDILKGKELKEFIRAKSGAWITFDKVKNSLKQGNKGEFVFKKKSADSLNTF